MDVDRSSSSSAQKIVELILPDEKIRVVVLGFLADTHHLF